MHQHTCLRSPRPCMQMNSCVIARITQPSKPQPAFTFTWAEIGAVALRHTALHVSNTAIKIYCITYTIKSFLHLIGRFAPVR